MRFFWELFEKATKPHQAGLKYAASVAKDFVVEFWMK